MKKILISLILFAHLSASGQEKKLGDLIDFHSYIQLRGISNFDNYTSFSLRRFKLWAKSSPEFSEYWSYKVQVVFSSFMQEKFFLQDVKIGYKTGLFSFDFGQFVPAFSLQRFQPDYKIPPVERAKEVNVLIPDGTLGVRDIGVQANFQTQNKLFETHLGLFNGYGVREYRFSNEGYMFTNKSLFNITHAKYSLKLGYSLQYRDASNLQLHFIFPDTLCYTGRDFRYNIFGMFKSKTIWVQTEYIGADFEGQTASGYYFLTAINYRKNQWVFSFENYKDLITETADKPYYRIAYNYRNKEDKIKLSVDNYFQITENQINKYFLSIQLQFFII